MGSRRALFSPPFPGRRSKTTGPRPHPYSPLNPAAVDRVTVGALGLFLQRRGHAAASFEGDALGAYERAAGAVGGGAGQQCGCREEKTGSLVI